MTLTCKKYAQTDCLLWMLILYPFLLGTLNELLGLPWALRYLMDVAWGMGLLLLLRFHRRLSLERTGPLLWWALAFLGYTLAVYLTQYQSALYYLWGLRNTFRFYVAFFLFSAFLTEEKVHFYFRQLDKLFWLNAAVSLVQFFFLERKGDHLGGIFGTQKGANAYTNLFFLIVLTRSLLFALAGREAPGLCLGKFAAASLIAALAELKFFFLELGVVILLSLMLTGFSWGRFRLLLLGALAALAGIWLMCRVFPALAQWFSLENLWESALSDRGYTATGDLNRLNGITQINARWLKTLPQRLFGLGLGNCETAAFPLVNTPFYQANSAAHYTWMSHTMLYLETGILGLIFHFGFFLGCYRLASRAARTGAADPLFCSMAKILAVCCCLISIYNASLRGEAGYMAYFVLALPAAAPHPGGNHDTLTAN